MSFFSKKYFSSGYTDLACELVKNPKTHSNGVSVEVRREGDCVIQHTTITTPEGAKKIGKPIGTYINIEGDEVPVKEIFGALVDTIKNNKKILVVGLGNEYFVADSLGGDAVKQINAGARIKTFCPSVYAVTGIESAALIKAVVAEVKPTCVIIIDSLVCREPERIGRSFQIADSGISPASAIRTHTHELSHKTLGVQVVAVGVPLCMRLDNGMLVLPKDIDAVVAETSSLIAKAINLI